MNIKLKAWSILFVLMMSACSKSTAQAPQPVEQPPTPYPDTPSPARIDAPRVEAPEIIDFDMFNELDRWAVTGAAIVRTNDGGLTWYNVSPPEMSETGYNVDTFFLDNGRAWVQKPDPEKYSNSGTLYRTSDGCRTRENQVVPFSRVDHRGLRGMPALPHLRRRAQRPGKCIRLADGGMLVVPDDPEEDDNGFAAALE